VKELPTVAGNRLPVSHAAFEQSCLVLIAHQEAQILPDNAIVAVLCNAIRLSREHCEFMQFGDKERITELEQQLAQAQAACGEIRKMASELPPVL